MDNTLEEENDKIQSELNEIVKAWISETRRIISGLAFRKSSGELANSINQTTVKLSKHPRGYVVNLKYAKHGTILYSLSRPSRRGKIKSEDSAIKKNPGLYGILRREEINLQQKLQAHLQEKYLAIGEKIIQNFSNEE